MNEYNLFKYNKKRLIIISLFLLCVTIYVTQLKPRVCT